MSPEQFLKFATRQLLLAQEVHCCYEAGPFGYSLHRRLLEMGIQNVVVRPQNWAELGRGVKTDKTDALAVESRHREQLQKDRQTHEAQGRSLLLYQGYRITGQWWKEAAWQRLKKELPSWLAEVLENLRVLILSVDSLLQKVSQKIEDQAQGQPKGFGLLTSEVLRREVLDWQRFANRRQVASLTGMCPGVRASGPQERLWIDHQAWQSQVAAGAGGTGLESGTVSTPLRAGPAVERSPPTEAK